MKRYKKLRTILLLVFVITLNSYFSPLIFKKAYADELNLKIQPSNLTIDAKTSADIRAPFTLTNEGLTSVTVNVLLKTFRGPGDDTGKVIYTNSQLSSDEETDSFLKQVQILDDGFAVSSLTLGPKQQKQLQLRISLPQDSKTQDHYFSVIFITEQDTGVQALPDSQQQETISNAKIAITLPVLLAVNRGKDQTGFLDTFSGPFFIQTGPVPFTVRVENTGEHFIEARGVIFVKNMFGQIVGKIELPPTSILAGSTRSLTSVYQPTSFSQPPKTYWSEKFLFGFYTATLALAMSPDQSLYTRSIYFVAFPVIGLVGILLFIALGFYLILRIKRKLSKE